MKKLLMCAIMLFSLSAYTQIVNNTADWGPTTTWTLSGSYNAAGLFADPTGVTSFGFDDDAAGNGSVDQIDVASPVIDLTAAVAGGESNLIVSVDLSYRTLGSHLFLEYFDADLAAWQVWDTYAGNSTGTDYITCTSQALVVSSTLDVSAFTATQQSGFRYRLNWDDAGGWQWGFCFGLPTITSSGCTSPTFTVDLDLTNCPTSFDLTVDVTDIGSAPTGVDISDDINGVASFTNVGVGMYTLTGFAFNDAVVVTVADNADGTCNSTVSITIPAGCPPPNDLCANAQTLVVGASGDCPTNLFSADATFATETPDELVSCDGGGNIGVWFTFTAPSSGGIDINYTAGTATGNPGVVVFDGCGGSEVAGSCQNNPASILDISGLTPGLTYHLLVWFDSAGAAGTFDICLESPACVPPTVSAVWDFTNCPTTIDVDLSVSNLGTSTTVDISNDINATTQTNVGLGTYSFSGFALDDVITFTIADNMDPLCFVTETITIGSVCPPSNTSCAGAISVPINACMTPTVADNTGATDSGEGTPACNTYAGGDLWYSITVPASGSIDVFVSVNNYSTFAGAVYTGSCGALIEEACDGVFGTGSFTLSGLTPGTSLLRVWDFGNNDFGPSEFCYGATPPIPGNDECSAPTTIMESTNSSCNNILSSTTLGATVSTDNSCGGGDEVWFTYTGVSSGITIETSNYGGPTPPTQALVTVYTGTCGGGLTQEACGFAPLGFLPTASTVYLISVETRDSGNSNTTGDFDLCIYSCPPPANNTCGTAALLTESPDDNCVNEVAGTTVCSTPTADNTQSAGSDVWYDMTAATSDIYRFVSENTTDMSPSLVAIYSGSCGALVFEGSGLSPFDISLTAATAYKVMVTTLDAATFPTQDGFTLCAYPPFPITSTVTCGTPLNDTYCYTANDLSTFLYLPSDGVSSLQLTFNSGYLESCCDNITIYDGSDNTGPVLFTGNNGGDLTGVTVSTTGPALFYEIDSDGSVQCDGSANAPFDYDVECLSCTPGAGTAVVGTCDDINSMFTIDVDVTNIGDGSVVISNDGGVGSTTVTAVGVTNIGPFPFATAITVTLGHPTDPTCDVVLPAITLNGCPPANDDCSNAIGLTVNADLACGTVTAATNEFSTASSQADDVTGTPDNDVWFSFTATSSAHNISLLNIVAVVGTSTDMGMGLYDGTGTCAGLVFFDDSDPESFLFEGLSNGTVYYLRVYGWYGSSSSSYAETTFDVCVGTPPPPPVNDDCGNATMLAVNADLNCGSFTSGTLVSSTASPDAETCSGSFDDDVWYSFVADETAHEVQCNNIAGSNTDLIFQLSEGTCGALTQLACGDSPDSGFTASGLTIGNTYYVRVATWTSTGGQTTTFDMCIGTPPPAPVNDDCDMAISVTETDFNCTPVISGSTISATQSTETTLCSTSSNDDDVWYSFIPLTTGNYNFDLSNTSTTTYVNIYSGTCAGGLTDVGSSCFTSSNDALLTASTTYLVQVYTSSTSATTDFDLCIYPDPTCAAPSALSTSANTLVGADITWTDNASAGLWDLEIVLAGNASTGTPTNAGVTSNPFTWTGGMSGTAYEVYVRADCTGGDFSPWIGPVELTTLIDLNCGSTPTNYTHCYSNFDATTWTYEASDPANVVTLTFNAGGIESCCDNIIVYDGADDSAPILYDDNNSGDLTGLVIQSTGNKLHFTIDSDSSVSCDSGSSCCTTTWDWDAECSLPCSTPTGLSASNVTSTGADLIFMGNAAAVTFDLEVIAGGATPTGVPNVTGVTSPYTWSSGVANTTYDFYVRANCAPGIMSDFASPETFTTALGVACGSAPTNYTHCYSNNDAMTWTYNATDAMKVVKLTFNAGTLESCCDNIIVYDGPDAGSPELYNGNNGGDLTGLIIQSSGPDLYLTISSDGNGSCDQGTTGLTTSMDWDTECADNPCAPSLTLSGTNSGDNSDANNMADNESSGLISSTQIIGATAVIDYDSATEIELLSGFETMLGAIFEAFIDGCNGGSGGSVTIQSDVESSKTK